MITGGFGSCVREKCAELGLNPPAICFGVGDVYLQHGSHSLLMRDAGLDAETIARQITEKTERNRK